MLEIFQTVWRFFQPNPQEIKIGESWMVFIHELVTTGLYMVMVLGVNTNDFLAAAIMCHTSNKDFQHIINAIRWSSSLMVTEER